MEKEKQGRKTEIEGEKEEKERKALEDVEASKRKKGQRSKKGRQ